ncbi:MULTISPECIES: AbiTii domain-containing protein [Enterobacter]|uniref:AbiTii domain-containing protein n=2 Tax=Enterobacter TaxID=547 RepID=UPI0027B8EE56|nr:hypothetical protein [Enterobacter bugandensis]
MSDSLCDTSIHPFLRLKPSRVLKYGKLTRESIMPNSPVLELQELASSRTNDIVDVLLKAKMIAVKPGLNDLSEWLKFEIDGYPNAQNLPEYRIGRGSVKALNPVRGCDLPPVLDTTIS